MSASIETLKTPSGFFSNWEARGPLYDARIRTGFLAEKTPAPLAGRICLALQS